MSYRPSPVTKHIWICV